ncbi:hypothetical protein EV356DRAFT_525983 [Viridothelium virens]|uniref:Nicotinamide N-methyltransferase n=1 Tax=Viridothelium virens TaxID=1048519 RepID=A0A6A6GZT6_VIRVR|nr:hypothetical protein EV356DRAFT_525983 [Viridothelium virens]
MRLTDRIQTVPDDPEEATDPADIFHDAVGSIFSDDVRDQHGHPSATILYKSEKYGTLKLKVATPEQELDWRLFAHYLWNAGVKMAILWNVAGERVLELGSGCGLPGIVATLAGATEVKLSDYPSPSTFRALHHNIATNVPVSLQSGISAAPHVWGDFFTSSRSRFPLSSSCTLSASQPRHYTRVLAADTYWLQSQHANLARSMLHFLAMEERARVLMIAGFHTGRKVLGRWFETAKKEGLDVEVAWEESGDGAVREWMVGRQEGFEEEKKWMVLAVLKRKR